MNVQEEILLKARGVVKMCYFSMVDDKSPKAEIFMNEYYKLLATRKYGKSVTAISGEVERMDKEKAVEWINKTYEQFIYNDMEIYTILKSLKEA